MEKEGTIVAHFMACPPAEHGTTLQGLATTSGSSAGMTTVVSFIVHEAHRTGTTQSCRFLYQI